MGTVLVYDWDFFHYSHVIPNLECAKLAAYRKYKRDITVFSPNLEPERYTKTYFRKEYNDGIYTQEIQKPTVEYGGRAFSNVYKPFELECEKITPDFSIYERYASYYSSTKNDMEQFKSILTATHQRLSLDGKHLDSFPFDRLQTRYPCVILHDYDIASIENSFDLISEICAARPKGRPYGIGNKYPIQIYNYQDLKKWLNITPMANLFFLQYNGALTDEEIIDLINIESTATKQVLYNFTYNCANETEFMIKVLPQIYKQALFLRRNNKKILLNIDNGFFKTKELLNLMKLINCYYGKTILNTFTPNKQTLYAYCRSKKVAYMEVSPYCKLTITKNEMRESFQYIREHNYEVFDMFYSIPSIIEKGGKLINEWE